MNSNLNCKNLEETIIFNFFLESLFANDVCRPTIYFLDPDNSHVYFLNPDNTLHL